MTGNEKVNIVVQQRDIELLRAAAEMRVFCREQAKCIAGFRSTTRVNSRLLLLRKAGLLTRYWLGTFIGGRKAVYAVSEKTAKLLGISARGPRRKAGEVLVVDTFVIHQLAVNDVHCRFKCGTSPDPNVRFVRWVACHAPVATGIPLIPDGYCEIQNADKVIAAFIEVDLGNESQKTWKGKVEQYINYRFSGHFQPTFKQSQFRVLVVVSSEQRMRSIRTTVASLTEKLFWFTTIESINRDGPWAPIWLRPKGDLRLSLL